MDLVVLLTGRWPRSTRVSLYSSDVFAQQFAKFTGCWPQRRHNVFPSLTYGYGLVLNSVEYDLMVTTISVNQKLIRGLTENLVALQTLFREVLRILRNDRICLRHDRGRKYMPIVWIGNAIDRLEQLRGEMDKRFRKCFVHLLAPKSNFCRSSMKLQR